MHPEDIEGYEEATEGERKVFRFLREAARPHRDYTSWYQPTLGGSWMEPDFILFGASLGLLGLEVRDWTCRRIASCYPHHFTLDISGTLEKKTNLDKQYLNSGQ